MFIKRFIFTVVLITSVFITIIANCFGASDPYITGDTVAFGIDPDYITFNSVTNWVRLTNYSDTRDCQVDLTCRDAIDGTGYTDLTKAFITIPRSDADSNSPSTVEFKVSTKNIAFIATTDASGGSEVIEYMATSDRDFDF